MITIYENNSVEIEAERDYDEAIIKVNGKPLIVIISASLDDFKEELTNVLNKYRI